MGKYKEKCNVCVHQSCSSLPVIESYVGTFSPLLLKQKKKEQLLFCGGGKIEAMCVWHFLTIFALSIVTTKHMPPHKAAMLLAPPTATVSGPLIAMFVNTLRLELKTAGCFLWTS